MEITICFLMDINDLYEDFFIHLGVSKQAFKKNKPKKKQFKRKDLVKLSVNLMRRNEINPSYLGPPVEVLEDNENFIALNKPAGVHGHPLSFSETDTLLNFLRSTGNFRPLGLIEGGAERGLLYRLDKETSGVVVIAKNSELLSSVRANFNDLIKEKIYDVLVSGECKKIGEVNHRLKPFGPKGGLQKEDSSGQVAIMSIFSSEYSKKTNRSLLKVKLKTGLRHQIRAQLSILGHPIVGDNLYGGQRSSRLFLHAHRYSFPWKGDSISLTAKRPLLFDKFFNLDSGL